MFHAISVRRFSGFARRSLTICGTCFAVSALVMMCPQPTPASPFTEFEPNNNFASGQILAPTDGTITLTGFREAGAGLEFNDFFRFNATAGDVITLRVLPSEIAGDSVLRLFNPGGILLAENDDCEDSFGLDSCIPNFSVLTTGLYGVGIRGVGNDTFNYTFTVTGLTPTQAVPEPTTLMLFGTGVAAIGALIRRRRDEDA